MWGKCHRGFFLEQNNFNSTVGLVFRLLRSFSKSEMEGRKGKYYSLGRKFKSYSIGNILVSENKELTYFFVQFL